MPKIPEYLFHLIYGSRCFICKNESVREHVNRLLYNKYEGKYNEGKKITREYIKKHIEKTYRLDMPSLPAIKRHEDNHFIFYLEHQDKIPRSLIIKYENSLMESKDIDGTDQEYNEIRRRLDAVENDNEKIYDVFLLTGVNTTTGINTKTGEKCKKYSWKEWCYRHLKVEYMDGTVVPMELPKHGEDMLYLMDKYPGILLLIARGHIKSTLLQIFTLRKICDFGWRFLYIGGSNSEVERYTENIRTELKENPTILYDYGYLPHPVRGDNKKALYLRTGDGKKGFSHDPHLTFATPPSSSGGTSKLGGHSNVIVLDDIQNENTVKSEKLLEKHEDWIDRNILPMRKGGTKIIFAGTRKSYYDIYGYIKKKKLVPCIESPAIILFPNPTDPNEYKTVKRPDGVEYMSGGQMESIPDDPNKWHYVFETIVEEAGSLTIEQELLAGVANLKGGRVFWDEWKKEEWPKRKVKYLNKDGSYNKQLMTMQELLMEKYVIEADPEKGHFSFWSEYLLNPVELKGRHLDTSKIKYFDYEMWEKIVDDEAVPKFTWIDVGYSDPNSKTTKTKDAKKGKTVLCTAALITPNKDGQTHYKPNQAGMYILEVRTGDYFIDHGDPKKSLIAQLLLINDSYKPQVICFEDNFFGKYIRTNTQIYSADYHLPITGKKNNLDKTVRISNGMNGRLNNKKLPFWMCEESKGFGILLRQIAEFPNCSKVDEIDAVESCDRLLVRRSSKLVLIGNGSGLFSGKNDGLIQDSGAITQKGLSSSLQYRYYKGRKRSFI